MNEIMFRKWLNKYNVPRKVQSDYISRIKRIESETGYNDIDIQYENDKCDSLLSLFSNRGINNQMNQLKPINLPLGKHYMSTYKHAVKKYIQFLDEYI